MAPGGFEIHHSEDKTVLLLRVLMPPWEEFQAKNPRFSNIDPLAVKNLVAAFRPGIPCHVAERFHSGADNVAFKVAFNDGKEWIIRVSGKRTDRSAAYVRAKIESAVATMRCVKASTTFPVPTVFGYEAQKSLPGLGEGYIAMELIPGCLIDDLDEELPDEEKSQIFHHLADITNQLWKLRFEMIGPIYQDKDGLFYPGPFVDELGNFFGPFSKTTEFFKHKLIEIHRVYDEYVRNPELCPAERTRCETLCALFDELAPELYDYDHGSFPLAHDDLGTHNVLFVRDPKGDWQVSGVIDWDYAHASAWEEFGQFPACLEIDWPLFEAGEYNATVIEDIRREEEMFVKGILKCEDVARRQIDQFLLSEIIDSPAVRVAEFILRYWQPEKEVSSSVLLKYVRAWRPNWTALNGQYDPELFST